MKKIFFALLAVVILFSFSGCDNGTPSKENTAEKKVVAQYMGEWKANSLKSRLDNEITYQVATITLKEDGTCIYKGESAKWEYLAELNRFVFTLDRNGVTGTLEIAEENGKAILKYVTETYYRPEDFVAKDKEYVGIDGTPIPSGNSQEITITLDNWNEYFEIFERSEWQRNAFGEAENLRISQYIRLKDQYREILDIDHSKVAFEIHATKVNVDIKLDFAKEKYAYTDTVNETYEFRETSSVTYTEECFYSCCDGYFTKAGIRVPNIVILKDINVSRAEGRIFLFEQ